MSPVTTAIRNICPVRSWDDFSPQFYTTFWSLQMYDLQVPSGAYEKQMSHIDGQLQAIEENREMVSVFNPLAPGRPRCHFKTAIFNLILLIGIFTSTKYNALRWMPWDLTYDNSTLVQVMAWCRQATSHYLSQCWPSSMSPYGVTKPQWVNIIFMAWCSKSRSITLLLIPGGVLGPKNDGGVPLAAENWTQKDRGKNEIWGLKDRIL